MLIARSSSDRRGGVAQLVRPLTALFIGLAAASAVMRARPRIPARRDVAFDVMQPRPHSNRAPANATPPTYVFMHILKTGGTSLGWLLASQHAHRAQTAPAARAMCHLFQLPLVSYQSDLSRANILSGDDRCVGWVSGTDHAVYAGAVNDLDASLVWRGRHDLAPADCGFVWLQHYDWSWVDAWQTYRPASPLRLLTFVRHPASQFVSYFTFHKYCTALLHPDARHPAGYNLSTAIAEARDDRGYLGAMFNAIGLCRTYSGESGAYACGTPRAIGPRGCAVAAANVRKFAYIGLLEAAAHPRPTRPAATSIERHGAQYGECRRRMSPHRWHCCAPRSASTPPPSCRASTVRKRRP